MVPWVGLIGRLVDLVLTKVVAKRIDLALDERKRAARAFLKLHSSLAALERAAGCCLDAIRPILDGGAPRIYRVPLGEVAAQSDQASREFLRAVGDLLPVVQIFDPTLGSLLSGVAMTKAEILSGAALTAATSEMAFRLLPNPDSVFAIGYSSPDEEVTTTDLELAYNRAAAVVPGRRLEWPDDVLLTLVRNHRREGRLADNDKVGLSALHDMVLSYLPHLVAARDHLESFIRERFSIEDLL